MSPLHYNIVRERGKEEKKEDVKGKGRKGNRKQ